MQETVLGKVIRHACVTGQLSQEVSYLRLMTADQLTEGGGVLRPDRQRDEVLILAFQRCCYISNVRYP